MLTTFVIGLREGLEASLIVGIVAAFLRRQERTDALRWMWLGVGLAVGAVRGGRPSCCGSSTTSCLTASRRASRRSSALVAVAMVTFMIVWMSRHARDLKGQLRASGGRARSPQGSVDGARGDGLPRRAPRGLRDRGLPARRLQRRHRPGGRGPRRRARRLVAAVALGFGHLPRRRDASTSRASSVPRASCSCSSPPASSPSSLHTAHEAGWLVGGQAQALRPHLARRPGTRPGVAAHRHARDPARSRP